MLAFLKLVEDFWRGMKGRGLATYLSRPSPTTLAFANCFVRIW